MNHVHDTHSHNHAASLRTAFVLTIVILVLEAVVGYRANSLALMSDAGHILTDAFALGLAWWAAHLAGMPPDEANTFGYRRGGILAALGNAAVLLIVAVAVAVEAALRLHRPERVSGGLVIAGAVVALVINAYIARSLHVDHEANLNIRAALLHVLGDMAASVGVVISGVVVLVWHAYGIDPVLSLLIAGLIGYGAWQIVRDTVAILMEGTPRGIDLAEVQEAMLQVPGVQGIHDLHIWSLSDGFRLLTAHIQVPEQSLVEAANLLADLKLLLNLRFHIEHATLEVECVDCRVPQRRPIRLHETGRTADR